MPVNSYESSKSPVIAETARASGNRSYADKSFFDALLKYNESLCHAAAGSDAVGLAYANRSAVFFEMKHYNRCLKNIELAKANSYPEKNISILEKRALKCQEAIKSEKVMLEDDNPFDFIKLTYEANPRLPFVANCLELRKNEKFGRYVITNRDLKVGDIIAIETPHFRIIKSDGRYDSCQESNKYQRCSYCLKDNLMDLIPCESCSSAMFCDVECQLAALKSFHYLECPIIARLLKSGVMQMAMRSFFQALSIFEGSIEEMEKFVIKNSKQTSVYHFDFSDNENIVKNYLASMLSLSRNPNSKSDDSPEMFFKEHPLLASVWETHEAFIRSFVQRILQVGDSNFHGICGWSIKKYENQSPQMIGIGCYPFISLANHSCAPNVNRIYVEDKMLLLVERPIARGEQIFDCYRSTFFTQPKNERQLILLNEYSFRCDCLACSNNFPMFHQLKSFDKKIYKLAKKGKDEISKLDKNQAKKRFREYCGIIQLQHETNMMSFSSKEVVLLQENILQCISIIIKPKLVFP